MRLARAVTILRVGGLTVRLHPSWAILAVLVAWSLAQGFFPQVYAGLPPLTYWWMSLACVAGLLVSIVAHEAAHSLVARRHGIGLRGITLFVFGGVAELEEEPRTPRTELQMALAGPAASAALAVLFAALAALAGAPAGDDSIAVVLSYLALVNAALVAFNLVPAFPMDGGRVLRAALWQRSGSLHQATWVAARIGRGLALFLMLLGVLQLLAGGFVAGLWWVLLGLFVSGAADSAYDGVLAQLAFAGHPVERFMTRQPIAVPPQITVRQLVDEYVLRHGHALFPVVEGSRLVGCVDIADIREVPVPRWASATVAAVMKPCSAENTVDIGADAREVFVQMNRTGRSRLLVLQRGELAGILTLKDLLRWLTLRRELESG